jgi:hypothetical protein
MACGCNGNKVTAQKINRPEQPPKRMIVKDLRQPVRTQALDTRPIHGYNITGKR